MHPTTQQTPPLADTDSRPAVRPVVAVAAMASAAAGLVHAAAAGSHSGDGTVALLFALAAALQLGWAALIVTRPGRELLAVGALLNAGMVGLWALSRAAGWPLVSVLSAREPVGTQDLLAAGLGALAVAAAALAWAGRPSLGFLGRPRVPAAVAGALLVAAVVGMSAEHTHGPSHEHAHGHPGAEVVSDDGHGHQEAAASGHSHGDDDHAHIEEAVHQSTGPVISLDDSRITPQQREAAQQLIDVTTEAMARFPDVESVQAAGYVSIGDGRTGYEHFIHIGHLVDSGSVLDPERIESIVAQVNPDGTKEIVSAMYILPPGFTMDDAPDIAGELTMWHDHQDLCWEGIRVVATLDADGNCPRGTFRPTPPMLHVWLVEHPCGPFAGIEGSHGSSCTHDH
jgi:hypothetical protein